MITNDTLLYSYISFLSNHHQRSFTQAADGNICRDSQPDIMHSESKWNFSVKYLASELRVAGKRRRKECKNQRGMDNTRKTRPSESTKQSTYELTETGKISTGPIQICTRSSLYIL